MASNIIIRKQKFRIRTPDEATALQVRRELNDSLHYGLLNILERVFQQKAPADLHLYLDRLSVDLGTIPQQDFLKQFLEKLEIKLGKEVEGKIQQQESVIYPVPGDTGNEFPWIQDETDAQHGTFSEREQQFRALIYFLEKGIFPWWYHPPVAKTPKEILASFGQAEMERLALRLIDLNVKERHISEKFIRRIITYSPPGCDKILARVILSLKHDAILSGNAEAVLYHEEIFEKITGISHAEFLVVLVKVILDISPDDRNFIKIFTRHLMQGKNISEEELRMRLRDLQKPFPENISNTVNEITGDNEYTVDRDAWDEIQQAKTKELSAQDINESSRSREPGSFPEEGIYISNAGIVIMHPFLESLFASCGLLGEKRKFISESAAIHAAILLWYLQTGEDEYREWDMALFKIICGLEVETPVPDGIKLTGEEKKECEDVLKVVLEYWDALRTANPEALRTNFFNREGKIIRGEDHWLLKIERTGIDILLDKLPWGYGTIKFPWLQHLIHVEW